jgi:hypothetical protein
MDDTGYVIEPPSRTAASRIAKTRGLKLGDYLGCLETIAPNRSYHGIIDLYAAEYVSDATRPQAEYEFVWLPLTEVTAMSFDQAGSAPFIMQQYLADGVRERITWVVD